MAAERHQAAALSHCHKATVLGNVIAIHMLEYITAASSHHEGLNELAHDFLDVCRIMWSIEAGLVEYTRTRQSLPVEMTQELDRKFNAAHGDFQALDHWLNRSLNEERGGAGKKLTRGWRKMFSGNEIPRMRSALGKTRESLRMSALVFQWSIGEEKIDESLGIGYTALLAALDRLEGNVSRKLSSGRGKPSADTSFTKHNMSRDHVVEIPTEEHVSPPGTVALPRSNTVRSSISGSAAPFPPPRNDSIPRLPDLPTEATWGGLGHIDLSNGSRKRTASHHTDTMSTRSVHSRTTPPSDPPEDLRSAGLAELENLGLSSNDYYVHELKPTKVVRLDVNPSKMPRWAPRNSIGADTPTFKYNLMTAIRERNNKAVEQLLDRGVPPNLGAEQHPLNEAIRQHDLEIVRLLLLFGANPNEPGYPAVSPLVATIEEGFLDAAAILLKYGADSNRPPAAGQDSPFGLAITKEDTHFTRLFLMYGADVNQMMADGETVLTKMITDKCNKSLVDMILDYGADANGKTREGKTALFEAITAGRPDIVTALLDHNANPNLPGPKHMLWPATYQPKCLHVLLTRGADHKKTPGIMELATSINKIDSVKVLLQVGVDPNAKKDGVYSPLCSAIRDNRADIFHLLLANGADPNVPASEYPCFKCVTHSRMHFLPHLITAGGNLNSPKGIAETAVQHNDMDALTWLLDNGVSPNDQSPDSKATPLTTAIILNKPEFVEALLARGANPNVRGQDWPVCMAVRYPDILRRLLPALAQPRAFKGVMEMAVAANELESVKLLLAAGVSVEDRNGGVFSPLTTAIRERHKDIVQYLLEEAGADPNSPGEHLPIVKALRRYEAPDSEVIEMLLRKGADPNKVYRGHSAIIQAVEMGDAHLLRLLIDKWGVDLEAVDDAGRTPVEIAETRGWDEGKAILLKGRKAV
ncbi:putative ankyrin repeat domain-containing protein 50 [Rosellinia necatrix]|uniref:Putative ankyrin repeat domain-containing protein 50 n=1 Tax=Rosellinia necatrix TaxID=77044 RepID=A0A1W2TF79_ROSNE|nr:putative ankyrin repeat domain-containing protein 50 [Rosellinia necatrix]